MALMVSVSLAQSSQADGNYPSYDSSSTDYTISDDSSGTGETPYGDGTGGAQPEAGGAGGSGAFPEVVVVGRHADGSSTIRLQQPITIQGNLGPSIFGYDGGGSVTINIPIGATFTGPDHNKDGIPDAFTAEVKKGTIKPFSGKSGSPTNQQ